jgi:hypothetical protein
MPSSSLCRPNNPEIHGTRPISLQSATSHPCQPTPSSPKNPKDEHRNIHAENCAGNVVRPPDTVVVCDSSFDDDAKSTFTEILLFSWTMSALVQQEEHRADFSATKLTLRHISARKP